MSERARDLAERFERVSDEFVAVVERLSEAEWQTVCPAEGRTVAALGYHVSVACLFEIKAFRAIAEGKGRRPFTWAAINRANAEDAEANAHADRAETILHLRRNAETAAAIVRRLTDDQLDRDGLYIEGEPRRTVERWIEDLLLGHVQGHLDSIKATLGLARPEPRTVP